MICSKQRRAFTLAEVLIALALLAILAAFSIPKLLLWQTEATKKAIFKEIYADLSRIAYERKLSGDTTSNVFDYYKARLNTLKTCDNSMVDGCVPSEALAVGDNLEGGFILPNGATIFGMGEPSVTGTPTATFQAFYIDWNGTAPPNTNNEDSIALYVNVGSDEVIYHGVTVPPGRVVPANSTRPLFDQMMLN